MADAVGRLRNRLWGNMMVVPLNRVWITVVIFWLIALGSYGYGLSDGIVALQKSCIVTALGMALTMMANRTSGE